jgi:hypothetical protein
MQTKHKKTLGHQPTILAASLAAVLGGACATAAQGGVLYFDFNANLNTPNASVFLFGDAGQTATVSNLAGFNEAVTLSADGFYNLFIPSTYQQSGTGVLQSGFKVVSEKAIAGYFINRASATTDMTYLLDEKALGTSYVVASMGAGFGEGSQVAIHATQNNTAVTFTPKGGAAINVTLNAGETYKYAGGTNDLTGSTVSADKAVAVFGGHNCAQVLPGRVACDTLLEQMIPNSNLSKSYLVSASKAAAEPGIGNDVMRVIATANNTEVKVDGAVVATLNSGEFYQFSLSGNSGAKIDASNPVMVAQYLIGQGSSSAVTDPALSLVPGSDTWLKAYKLSTPTGDQSFLFDYASLVIETDDLDSLKLNGALVDTSAFTAIAGTLFSRGVLDLPDGLYTLVADDPFLVMLGGAASFDSYLTYGGSTFSPGVSPPPTPGVPEPGTLALLGLGLAGLRGMRRRKA